ncbi:MAG: TlyA family RNA methyltransferase [Actinomycetota bacterium]
MDRELVARGLFQDVDQAKVAIEENLILVNGAPAGGVATLVGKGSPITFQPSGRFVSRGGDKLAGALDDLEVDVAGASCLDAGAGSGGFTDCLLRNGAHQVVAVDVGYGQFDWRLRTDRRVTLLERSNIRRFDPAAHGGPYDVVVTDLSFIGLRQVTAELANATAVTGSLILMVKPQFEAPRSQVGPKGIVRDPQVWLSCMESVVESVKAKGLVTVGAAASQLLGAGGNQEFFIHARRDGLDNSNAISGAVSRAAGSRVRQ